MTNSESINLDHQHLFTLKLNVQPFDAHQIGAMSTGRRVIVPVTGGSFKGERLSGTVEPGGYDWAFFRNDGVMKIDVRLVLKTDTDELVYISYHGRLIAQADVHKRMAKGEKIADDEYSLTTQVSFETGAERLTWLNDVVAVGVGRQEGYQPTYEIFTVGA